VWDKKVLIIYKEILIVRRIWYDELGIN